MWGFYFLEEKIINIKEVLDKGKKILDEKNIDESGMKVRMLLSYLLGVSKEYVMVHIDSDVDKKVEDLFFENIEKIGKGYPIQYITKSQAFMDIDFYVDENVLITQPDTETLVYKALELIKDKSDMKILDLCTGSGAIVVSLANKNKNQKYFASDISDKALDVAKKNAKRLGVDIVFIKSDLFKNIKNQKFDLIVSNPPYIESKTINTLAKEVQMEPMIALDGGEDGLDFYRKIIAEGKNYLNENGVLLLEIGYNQKESVERLFVDNGYKNVECIKDLGNNDRVMKGNI